MTVTTAAHTRELTMATVTSRGQDTPTEEVIGTARTMGAPTKDISSKVDTNYRADAPRIRVR
jgi:hypothetical protein